ncbi:MAG: M23 family metallopeptidase [Nitrospira sp.]|nr:M23 family metallopeptidase [Nitrospira sp.]
MRTKMKLISLLIFASLFTFVSHAFSADYWSYPLSPWSPVTRGFGIWVSGWGYHLGEDVVKPAYTIVKNARWGYVRHVAPHTKYGWVVVIESPREWETSTDPKTWKNPICHVYGHLRYDSYLAATKVKLNKLIDRGWIIGRLGTSSENGGYTPHLHFGARKGRYTSTWVYWGYSTSSSVLSQWYKPSSVINNY